MELETLVALIGGIAGLFGALVGAGASIATTFLTNRHAVGLQSSANTIERQEKARAFQRETLLACQEAMRKNARLTGRAFYEEVMALHNGTPWRKHMFGEPLNTEMAESRGSLGMLVERIADDKLRKELKVVAKLMGDVQFSASKEEAENSLFAAVERTEKVTELLGTVLRETY